MIVRTLANGILPILSCIGALSCALMNHLEAVIRTRNLVLAGFALSATLPAIERALGWADYAVAMLAIAAATSLYIAANQLFANRPRLDALDDYMGAAS